MKTSKHLLRSLPAIAILLLFGACADSPTTVDAPPAFEEEVLADGGGRHAVGVMSRNVYLGGDVGPLLSTDFSNIPAGRWGAPSDVGSAVVYYSSEEAAFVTGQTLCVNGGNSPW